MIDSLASATCRLECATRALNTYLTLRTAAMSSDPEYQRLWQERVAAEQTYRTNLVALLANRDDRAERADERAGPANRDERAARATESVVSVGR